jgi:hypothetical protein
VKTSNLTRHPLEEERSLLGYYAVWPHGIHSKKTAFFIVNAVTASNLTRHQLHSAAGLMDALVRSLLVSDRHVLTARVLALNASSSTLINSVSWQRQFVVAPTLISGGLDHSPLFELGGPHRLQEDGLRTGLRPDPRYPWYENAETSPGLWSPKFMPSPTNMSFRGWWTFPYFSCTTRRWLLSYSVSIPPPTKHG